MRNKYVKQLKGVKEDFLNLHETTKKVTELVRCEYGEDKDVLEKIQQLDWNVRQLSSQIEENCIRILTTQQPLAKDLRFIFTVIKGIYDYKRISRDTFHAMEALADFLPTENSDFCMLIEQIANAIDFMMDTVSNAIIIESVVDPDTIIESDDIIDKNEEKINKCLEEEYEKGNLDISQVIALSQLARFLERVGDHICNIAEKWFYTIKGKRTVIK